jgi:hypothetical protein
MTGEFTWGFKSTNSNNGQTKGGDTALSSGFGTDYSNINFAATEDLGGGTKLSLVMGIDGADRSGDSSAGIVTGTDAKLALTNGNSKLLLATQRNYDYLSEGIAAVGNPGWIDLDGAVTSAHTWSPRIQYSYAFGPVTAYYLYTTPASGVEGAGLAGSKAQSRNLIGATYAAGGLTVDGEFGQYTNQVDYVVGATAASNKSVARLSGAYDLGVAKVGLGISNLALMQGNVNDTFVAAAVPLGALTLNANWGSRKFDNLGTQAVKTGAGNVTAEGTVNGYGIGAAYALSKRTQIVANYVSYDDVVNASNKNTTTKVYIDHSF